MPSTNLKLTPYDNARLVNLCGQHNQHLKQIEKSFDVTVHDRGHEFQIIGKSEINVQMTNQALEDLFKITESNDNLSAQTVHLILQKIKAQTHDQSKNMQPSTISIHTPKALIKAYSPNQINYINNIQNFDLNFGIGPAGTGKTYLAVASAVAALEQEKVNRIILVRPVVEAGEHLGFLPGDIAQKIDPYLRPLYDALYEMLGAKQVETLITNHIIELAPLAFMRGRTLNSAFIILDEGQNTTIEQMKMFLTRIGFGSKTVVTGDVTQIDLSNNRRSGLIHATEILKDIKEIKFNYFGVHDIVRHPLVHSIIQAYDKAK